MTDARLLEDLRSLVEPDNRGDPQSPLRWTYQSLRKLNQSLREMGHRIGRTLVGELLHQLDYSLQANRKTREGSSHPDRDAQFRYIYDRMKEALASGEPAISVDTTMNSASPLPCVTCRQAPANGTRSSIACFRSSLKTGAASRW
jgi:hypothetical protein